MVDVDSPAFPVKFEDMRGRTVGSIEYNDDHISFNLNGGIVATLYHEQNCCEHVHIEDIAGNLNDLLHSPLLTCYESSQQSELPDGCGTETWTFYRLSTIKGSVAIRFHGSSNGYYSESVDFKCTEATA